MIVLPQLFNATYSVIYTNLHINVLAKHTRSTTNNLCYTSADYLFLCFFIGLVEIQLYINDSLKGKDVVNTHP